MENQAVLACVDDMLRWVMHNNIAFGGKVIVLLGDFRQTCPVIRNGTKAQVVGASIRSSPLWSLFRNAMDGEFAAFVGGIGDGAGPEVALPFLRHTTSASDLVDFVFPADILQQTEQCLNRPILAPTKAQVDEYNNMLLHRLQGVHRHYLAADSVKEVQDAGLASPDNVLDFCARQTPPGLPPTHL